MEVASAPLDLPRLRCAFMDITLVLITIAILISPYLPFCCRICLGAEGLRLIFSGYTQFYVYLPPPLTVASYN